MFLNKQSMIRRYLVQYHHTTPIGRMKHTQIGLWNTQTTYSKKNKNNIKGLSTYHIIKYACPAQNGVTPESTEDTEYLIAKSGSAHSIFFMIQLMQTKKTQGLSKPIEFGALTVHLLEGCSATLYHMTVIITTYL